MSKSEFWGRMLRNTFGVLSFLGIIVVVFLIVASVFKNDIEQGETIDNVAKWFLSFIGIKLDDTTNVVNDIVGISGKGFIGVTILVGIIDVVFILLTWLFNRISKLDINLPQKIAEKLQAKLKKYEYKVNKKTNNKQNRQANKALKKDYKKQYKENKL